jgi:hypothetical protein
MLAFLKYWPYALAVIFGMTLGYPIGHMRGVSAGKAIERSNQIVTEAKEAKKAISQREKIENETRKLSNTDIDNELINNGWMRRDEDR